MANADYLVADEDGAIVGVTLSVFDGFASIVSYMAVAPGAERRNIGRRMIDELVRRTQARGGQNIVVASWLSAAGFYERMEFRTPGAVFLVRDVYCGPQQVRGLSTRQRQDTSVHGFVCFDEKQNIGCC